MIADLVGCTGGAVVADVNVLAKAGAGYIALDGKWPQVPPDIRPLDVAAVSVFHDEDVWSLWVSPEIRRLTREVMLGNIGEEFRLAEPQVDLYLAELDRVVLASKGAQMPPRIRVTNFVGDNEDDANVASLAASVPADVVISWDSKVSSLGIRDLPVAGGGSRPVRFVTCGDFVQHVHNLRTAEGGW